MKLPVYLCAIACVFISAGCVDFQHKAEIAGLLLDFKHDGQEKIVRGDAETENFRKAQAALREAKGRLQPVTQDEARKIFGEPVTVFKRGESMVWAYKPASSDWFKGEKIYLTFDRQGRLTDSEFIN
jgi:hypothetical protein